MLQSIPHRRPARCFAARHRARHRRPASHTHGPRRRTAPPLRHRLRSHHLSADTSTLSAILESLTALGTHRCDGAHLLRPGRHTTGSGLLLPPRSNRYIRPRVIASLSSRGATSTAPHPCSDRDLRRGTPSKLSQVIRPEQPHATKSSTARSPTHSTTGTSRRGSGFEAVRMIGHHDERTYTLRDNFAAKPHSPSASLRSSESEAGRRHLLDDLELDDPELPVVILQFQSPPTTLGEPDRHRDRRRLRAHAPTAADTEYDVTATSSAPDPQPGRPRCTRRPRGLRVMVIEHQAVGGQAGTSSLIRNYPGFPAG